LQQSYGWWRLMSSGWTLDWITTNSVPLSNRRFCFQQCGIWELRGQVKHHLSSNNTTIQGIGSSGWICMVNTSAIHNKGSEKWEVNEAVPHDKKLDWNLFSQLNK
jgi:hypothetical protein